MIARLCVLALLGAGCSAIVGLEDDSPPEDSPDVSAAERDAGAIDGATVDGAAADASEGPADDPNWAGWPAPPDSPSELTRAGDVVSDPSTGLDWHAAVSAVMPYADMAGYCEASTTGGHDDWRMPTWIELTSIVDYAHQDPAMNLGLFSAPSTGFVLSTTRYSVDRIVGIMLQDGRYTFVDPALPETYVHCVRGAVRGGTAPARRYDIQEEIVVDRVTQLEWQRNASSEPMPYAAAEPHCEALALDGGGWKVPSIKQLLTLFDATSTAFTRWYVPAFGSTVVRATWSRTSFENRAYWNIDFGIGDQDNDAPTYLAAVRCVRQ